MAFRPSDYSCSEPLSPYAAMLALFSGSVTLSDGRKVSVQPLTQIVWSMVACVTAESKTDRVIPVMVLTPIRAS